MCGEVVSLGYASTIDSAQGMTCSKVGLVLKGMENSHAFYSGGSRGILFPKILIFNNIGDLGDGSQFLQPEIEPRIVLEQVLSRSNRSPDVENLDFYLSEFRRLGDKFGENLVIQLLENGLGADLIPPLPPQPPPAPVIPAPQQQHSRSLFARNKDSHELDSHAVEFKLPSSKQEHELFEFGPTVDPIIPPSPPTPPPPVAPVVSPPSPLPSQTQTIEKICEDLLTLNVVDVVEVGEELFKRSKEFGEYLLTIDIQKQREIFNKIPDEIALRIVRREMQKKQPDLNILLTWEQVKQAPQQLEQNEREIEF